MYKITDLLAVMNKQDASDIYITVDSPPSYRINGLVKPAGKNCLSAEDTEKIAQEIMSEQKWNEFLQTHEANFALYYPQLGRYRVNVFVQKTCVGIVIRRIKTDIETIDDLGLPEILKKLVMLKRGLILVTGATGSGKSTSLAAMIDHRSSNEHGHIITVEEPIEFLHSHKKSIVTQREIGIDTQSYFDALKNTLRQAPDVILIGEIRDRETMESAINFAETGHLCLATLHSNNANQTIERILGFFPEERHKQLFLELSLNLRAIVSQRLVRNIKGGRAAAVEIMLGTPHICEIIGQGKVDELKTAMIKSESEGMQTFDDHLFALYYNGTISYEDALHNADSENNLRLRIKLAEESEDFSAAESFTSEEIGSEKIPRSRLEIE